MSHTQAPLSAAQRKQQLLGGSQMGKEVAVTPQGRGLGVTPKPQVAMRLAGLIQQAALAHLSKPPSSLAGLCLTADFITSSIAQSASAREDSAGEDSRLW